MPAFFALFANPLVRYGVIALAFALAVGVQQLRINWLKADLQASAVAYKELQVKVAEQNRAIELLAQRKTELQAEADKASADAVKNLLFATNYAKGIKFKAITCEQAGTEAHEVYAPVIIQKWSK